MSDETPPLLGPDPVASLPPTKSVNLSRLGMRLALVGPLVFLLFMVLRPG